MTKETNTALEIKKTPETTVLKESLSVLKKSLTINPILQFLESFDSFFKKKKKALTADEILFSPGENPYFYIISSGALSISQFTPTGEKKEVGRAYAGSFIGEGVLFDRNQKDVEAKALLEKVKSYKVTK